MTEAKNRCEWLETLPKHSVGAEIGVAKGRFSAQMLRRVQPRLLWLVDSWHAEAWRQYDWDERVHLAHVWEAARKLSSGVWRGVVCVLCGDSADVACHVEDESLDWIYIDADHTYRGFYVDLLMWFPKVKPNGLLSGHDYLDDAEAEPHVGVAHAVRDFMLLHGQSGLGVTEEAWPSWHFRKVG